MKKIDIVFIILLCIGLYLKLIAFLPMPIWHDGMSDYLIAHHIVRWGEFPDRDRSDRLST